MAGAAVVGRGGLPGRGMPSRGRTLIGLYSVAFGME
jgi:hypothetical protein